MSIKDKKSKKNIFQILSIPYKINDSDTMTEFYNRYLNDKTGILKINELTYYKSLITTKVNYRPYKILIVIDAKLKLKLNDKLIDENSNVYIVKEFPMFRFCSGIPEWYSHLSIVGISGNIDNIGNYFALINE